MVKAADKLTPHYVWEASQSAQCRELYCLAVGEDYSQHSALTEGPFTTQTNKTTRVTTEIKKHSYQCFQSFGNGSPLYTLTAGQIWEHLSAASAVSFLHLVSACSAIHTQTISKTRNKLFRLKLKNYTPSKEYTVNLKNALRSSPWQVFPWKVLDCPQLLTHPERNCREIWKKYDVKTETMKYIVTGIYNIR